VLLGSAYLSKRNPAKAEDAFRKMAAAAPKDHRAPYLTGVALQTQGKKVEAAQEFERALTLAPQAVEPLGALVAQALAARQPDRALARVKKQADQEPKSAGLQHLLGLVHNVRKETAAAEAAFLRALELDPENLQSYMSLGRLYLASRDEARALARFEEALRLKPADVVARMMTAQIHLGRGETAKAKAAYERILTAQPRFVPAANNLAWILAHEGTDKDRALQLAQLAKQGAPENPHVSDTLGWILFQRGLYDRAWNLLRESAAKLPDNPEVQYHAGLAARQLGQAEAARTFLQRAVASAAEFPAKREAQKALAELK
jgi:Tfp pilus assembly protein PilF